LPKSKRTSKTSTDPSPDTPQTKYQRRKDRERNRQANMSREGRDIAPVPAVKDPKKRAAVEKSFRRFCEECFPNRFSIKWSGDHLEVLDRIAECVLNGNVYALAMPRGSGKTTIVCAAVLWAVLTGKRKYVAMIGADRDSAQKLLAGLKVELETNDALLDLFPEACYPIRQLEGKGNRATGQLFQGDRTYIEWKGPRIVFASIPNAPCSAAIVEVCGILGRIRGMQFTRPDGYLARPDLFVLDDPQTDRSAVSESQVRRRLNIINGTVMGLAGPGIAMAGFATVTVIAPDDVADSLLNRDIFPDWQGKRYQLVYQWPTATDHWEVYATLRAEGMRVDGHFERATEYFRKHYDAMTKGAKVAWPERKLTTELHAIQHAYNLRLKSPDTFDAEYQNQPKSAEGDIEMQTTSQIEAKLHGYGRSILPPDANLVTSFVDVQGRLLYYTVVAWNVNSFTGWVVDYGTWPKQTANYFVLRGVEKTLARVYPKAGLEGRLRAGLFDLLNVLSSTDYKTPDGQSMRSQLVGVDAAWGPSTRIVQAVCAEHPKATWLMPYFGRGLGAKDRTMDQWTAKRGERKGLNWIIRPTEGGGRHSLGDTNYWKSFIHARWNIALGDPGSLSLFTPKLQTEHRMFAEHQRSEIVTTVTANGRSIEEWKLPPKKPDNHLFDCMVGSAIMASICGASLPEFAPGPTKRRKKTRTQFTI
jgi:hypothetical protein